MADFSYTARDSVGKIFKGSIEAEDETAVRAKLLQMGLYTTSVNKIRKELFAMPRSRIKLNDIVIFTERFSAMVDAGLPIIRCLSTIGEQTENTSLRKVIYNIRRDLEGGATLSDSLAKHPKVFSNFYVNLIRAGEAGGLLSEVLQRIADYLDREEVLRHRVKGAFAYPIIVLSVAVIIVAFLVTFIVPVFARVYTRIGARLPIPTLFLIGISRFVSNFWWLILLIITLTIFGYRKIKSTEKGALYIDRFKLSMPIFGNLNTKVAVSRFVRTFGSLDATGVPILQSLRVIREIAGNKVIANIIDIVQNEVREGKRIAEPLSRNNVFPPMVIQMVAAGEETGKLDILLKKSANFLDRDVENTIQRLVTRLEPLLTMFLAIVVAFIAIAIYLPMFDLISAITK